MDWTKTPKESSLHKRRSKWERRGTLLKARSALPNERGFRWRSRALDGGICPSRLTGTYS